ncbi:hypothetical protein L195_g061322, partial [Trifolium pratense]
MAKNFGNYSPPIPAEMMAQMAAMKLQDEQEAQAQQAGPRNQRAEGQQSHQNQEATSQQQTGNNNEINIRANGRITMETRIQPNGVTQTKRQRTDSTSPTNMEIAIGGTHMAG